MYIIISMSTHEKEIKEKKVKEKKVKEKVKVTKKQIIKRAILSLLVSVPLPLLVMISVPFEIFAANYNEYVFALSEFFPVCIGFFFLFTVVIYAAIFFLPKRAFRIVSAFLIAFTLMLFIQGNYLNGSMHTMGGDALEEGEGITTTIAVLNILLWVVVLAAAIVLACLKDRKNIISYIGGVMAIILLATQIVAPISVSISKSEVFTSASDKKAAFEKGEKYPILTEKNIHSPSEQSNVYWFIIDRFDESFAEEAYDTNPDLLNGLEGFTWFQNHLARYNHTYPSIVEMLTGNEYDPYMNRMAWFKKSYENAHTLDIMNENGYAVNIYTEPFSCFGDTSYIPSYVANVTPVDGYAVRNKVGLAFSIVGVGMYRNFPYYAKSAIDITSTTSNEYVEEWDVDGNLLYSSGRYPKAEFTTQGEKGFYFIHTEGCHSAIEPLRGGMLAVNNIKEINKYLDYLKEQGLYDNATIIITGDHGIVGSGGTFTKPMLTALFVKPSGAEREPLKISYAPTCPQNLWATIFKSEGIAYDEQTYGKSVFDIADDEQVVRYITYHTWNVFRAVTYEVVGDARDWDNWEIIEDLHLNKALPD